MLTHKNNIQKNDANKSNINLRNILILKDMIFFF